MTVRPLTVWVDPRAVRMIRWPVESTLPGCPTKLIVAVSGASPRVARAGTCRLTFACERSTIGGVTVGADATVDLPSAGYAVREEEKVLRRLRAWVRTLIGVAAVSPGSLLTGVANLGVPYTSPPADEARIFLGGTYLAGGSQIPGQQGPDARCRVRGSQRVIRVGGY